jgi:hypothetical protein
LGAVLVVVVGGGTVSFLDPKRGMVACWCLFRGWWFS